MNEERIAAMNDPNFGLQRLAIADSKLTPHQLVPAHYGFNEPGTWGYCSDCQFLVTLDEDGFIRRHSRRRGDWTVTSCDGDRKEPGIYYRKDYRAGPTSAGDDHPHTD